MSTPILELPDNLGLPQPAVEELNMRLLWIGQQLSVTSKAIQQATPGVLTLSGTRSQRLGLKMYSAQNNPGAQFLETDTTLVYVSRPLQAGSAGYVWAYLSGIMTGTFSGMPGGLGTLDTGLLYTITDKNRTLRWTGTGWAFAAWEIIPVGYVTGFKSDPGTGWHICDGSTVANGELHADGTLHNVTFDDLTGTAGKGAYPKWTSATGGVQVAIAPGLTGSTAGSSANILNGNAAIQGNTTGLGNDAGAGQAVQSGTGTTVAAHPHAHSDPGHTHSDTGHTHTDAGHLHSKGTLAVDATAEPQHYDLIPYQRV